jgi:predicted nucleic acid-binding protein
MGEVVKGTGYEYTEKEPTEQGPTKQEQSFVLDCSVSAAWCFSDEKNNYVDRVLDGFTHGYRALTPSIWYLEMITVLSIAEKRARLTRAASEHFIRMFSALPISTPPVFEPALDRNILSIARLYDLSAYDACYLQIAMEYSIPLATQDKLLRAASKEAGVEVFLL